jgi:putative transposase
MSEYRRWRVEGGTYFFTLTTHNRVPFLTTKLARRCLHRAFHIVRHKWPFRVIAVVLLPDHLHAVWELPRGDADYSLRWKRLKEEFTRRYLALGGKEPDRNLSRIMQGERAIWQRRFWEHVVDDEEALDRCVNYVHFNPVKHGLVTEVRDWKWSSFHRFVAVGHYDRGWGRNDPCLAWECGE